MQAGIPGTEPPLTDSSSSRTEPTEASRAELFLDDASTRYLCAGAYLDEAFRDWVLSNVYAKTANRTAPSYGFDLVPVVAHARKAWTITAAQNGCLTVMLIAASCYLAPSMAFLVTLAYLWLLVANVRTYLKQRMIRFFRLPNQKGHGQETLILAEERRHIRESASISLPLIAVTVALSIWLGWGIADVVLGAVAITLLAGCFYGAAELIRYWFLRDLSNGLRSINLNRRLKTIDAQQRSPVVAYVDEPFIGSGQVVHTWEFTQRLLRPTDDANGRKGIEFTKPPFRTSELVRHIRSSLNELAKDKGKETELPGLKVSDLLLVEGRHHGRYRPLLGRPPRLEEFEEFMADSRAPGRHHLACQVVSWRGDIVTTVYLHTSLQGGLLYLKYTIYALTPTPEHFQIIDAVGETDAGAMAKAALRRLLSAPRALLAPVAFWKALRMTTSVLTSPKDRTINARHNIGAKVSAREHLTTTYDRSYFQALDVAKHSKIIERRIISSVGEFLKGKVLTQEFEERTTYILNSGVLNMGSGDVSVGDGNTIGAKT